MFGPLCPGGVYRTPRRPAFALTQDTPFRGTGNGALSLANGLSRFADGWLAIGRCPLGIPLCHHHHHHARWLAGRFCSPRFIATDQFRLELWSPARRLCRDRGRGVDHGRFMQWRLLRIGSRHLCTAHRKVDCHTLSTLNAGWAKTPRRNSSLLPFRRLVLSPCSHPSSPSSTVSPAPARSTRSAP